tara:strand:+ start:91 stop:255 length:165 start_codon:yes stop_codon:yes gene_type:complete
MAIKQISKRIMDIYRSLVIDKRITKNSGASKRGAGFRRYRELVERSENDAKGKR